MSSVQQGFNPSYGLHALRALPRSWQNGKGLTGFNPSYGLHALRAPTLQSNIKKNTSFNPSYGLHALRARATLAGVHYS